MAKYYHYEAGTLNEYLDGFLIADEDGDLVIEDEANGEQYKIVPASGFDVPAGRGYQVNGVQVVGPQESGVASLTDNTGGTTDGTLGAFAGSTGDDATVNNNFAELNAKIDAIVTALENHGLLATA